MTTHPEIRPDKNGILVTRHIKNASSKNKDRTLPSAMIRSEYATCTFCSSDFKRGTQHSCRVPNLIETTPAIESILDACHKAGGKPLIVGGSVRDAILNRVNDGEYYKPKDIDIEVYGISDEQKLMKELRKKGIVNETGVSFGVLKIAIGDEDFDISLPRRDSKSGKGHRGFDVEVDATLDEAAAFGRRDFTINAIGYDIDKQMIVDCYGGSQDLSDGILRHTTSAFADDPLRVLRGVQFAARFGFEMAPDTTAESARIKDDFHDIAVERIWGEFDKIFTKGKSVTAAINVLRDTGWIEHFPELARMEGVEQDPVWHPEGNVLIHLGLAADKAIQLSQKYEVSEDDKRLLVFTAMVHDFGKFGEGTQVNYKDDGSFSHISSLGHADLGADPIRAFAKSIGAPRSVVIPAINLTSQHMSHATNGESNDPSTRAVRNLVTRLGDSDDGANIRNWAILVEADQNGRGMQEVEGRGWIWYEKAVAMNSVKPIKNLVDGSILKGMGLTPNPLFGEIIKASRVAQDNEEFIDSVGAEAWARNYVASIGLS